MGSPLHQEIHGGPLLLVRAKRSSFSVRTPICKSFGAGFLKTSQPDKPRAMTMNPRDEFAEALRSLGCVVSELNDTGRGIAFVLPVEKVVGVAHFMRPRPEEG
jgi:hypothetical protein